MSRSLKRGLALFLALSMAVCTLPAQPLRVNAAEDAPADGKETEADSEAVPERIDIYSAGDLAALAENCYVDSWSKNKYVTLQADIDLTGVGFKPIPVFDGIFNGMGHTISGFHYTGDGYVVGFFRYIESSGCVQNLTLKGSIESENEKECIGSLCGINYGVIKNCTFAGTVGGRDTVGGIVGINESTGTISGSCAKGRITGYYSTGGIAGINHGALSYCTNRAGINDDSAWVEVDDEMGGLGLIESLTSNDDNELYSGVDTGGIAGFSDGVISGCTNLGIVGYEHTGYNIGGIAGRQSGIVSMSRNNGTVYGRKDVGGIVGQMEPFIEIDEAESLRSAINKLHDLVEKTIDDMQATKDVVKGDVDTMQAYAESAIDAGDVLVGQLADFVDGNVDQINSLSGRLEHIVDMMPGILDDISAAGDAFLRLNEVMEQLAKDLDIVGKLDSSSYNETDYGRLALLSAVGGTLSADKAEPEANDTVTVTVKPDNGYELKEGSLVVKDAKGKTVTATKTGDNTYTFVMTKENVRVTAEFAYQGAFLVKSTVGGKNVDMSAQGDAVTFTAAASNGYRFVRFRVGGSDYAGAYNGAGKNSITLNKKDYIRNNTSVVVEAVFEETGGSASAQEPERAQEGESSAQPESETIQQPESGSDVQPESESGAQPESETAQQPESEGSTQPESESGTLPEGGDVQQPESEGSAQPESETIQQPESESSADTAYIPEEGQAAENSAEPENSQNGAGQHTYTKTLETYYAGRTGTYARLKSDSGTESREEAPKADDGYAVKTASSIGGAVTADKQNAAAGETVYILPVSNGGYVLGELKAWQGNAEVRLSKEGDGKRYSFTMPSGDVKVAAVFEPVEIILKSNLSGNAAFSVNNDGIVTLNIKPDAAYKLKSAPSVTGADGKKLSVSRKQEGSYLYEFDLSDALAPCTVTMTFEKQDKGQTVDTAVSDIEDAIAELEKASKNVQDSVNKIKSILDGAGGSAKDLTKEQKDELVQEILNLAEYLGDMSAAASSILSNLMVVYNILSPYVSDAAKAAKKDIKKATEHIQDIIDSLKAAVNGVRGITNYMNAQPDIQFAKLGDGFDLTKETFHGQLKGLSDSIKSLSDNASAYSDLVNDDLRAVNDQLNVVFNLLADRMVSLEDLSIEALYEDVDDENIDSITTGRADACLNTGVIKGDINVGGIAGSMAVDDEDPEDSAAGTVEYEIGRRFITKCLVTDSVNEGYVTAKKDGAGGICGYMNHGIIVGSEGYGSVESTEGGFVGGICGESLTIIKECYALCSVSGGKNVGGIAGYAETLKNCYSMASVEAQNGRAGAIAGQIASYGEVGGEAQEEEPKVAGNYYVAEGIYGIDNISYVGVAEPISYNELLTVEKLPTPFWHLKVIYKIEDAYLGSEEIAYGTVLDSLNYPQIPHKEGFYGVWPDVSDKKMGGTLVVEAEYRDNVTVVQSRSGEDTDTFDAVRSKPYALVEDIFTEDTILNVALSDFAPPEEAKNRKNVVYEVSLENSAAKGTGSFAIRVLNPFGDAAVYGSGDGGWTELESKVRGQYLQVDMTGTHGYFCVVEQKSNFAVIICASVAAGAALVFAAAAAKKARARRKKKAGGKETEQ